MTNIDVQHVDTCAACFVLDHCNGEDELLVGVHVTFDTNRSEVIRSVFDEVMARDKFPSKIEDEDLLAAILRAVPGLPHLPFDPSLELELEEELGEPVQAWFRISWEADL